MPQAGQLSTGLSQRANSRAEPQRGQEQRRPRSMAAPKVWGRAGAGAVRESAMMASHSAFAGVRSSAGLARPVVFSTRAAPQPHGRLVELGAIVADAPDKVIGLGSGQSVLARKIAQFVALAGGNAVAVPRAALAGIVR